MKLLSRNADLSAEAKLTAVGETSGSVDVYGSGINKGCKMTSSSVIFGNDRFAVTGGILCNMLLGTNKIVNYLDGDDIIVIDSDILRLIVYIIATVIFYFLILLFIGGIRKNHVTKICT